MMGNSFLKIAIIFAASAFISCAGYENFNGDILSIFVSILSIFSGILIALIALINKELIPNNKGESETFFYVKSLSDDLVKLKLLFYTSLYSIVLLLISELIKTEYPIINIYIKHAYILLGFCSIFYSFFLPGKIIKLQSKSLESKVHEVKDEVKVKNQIK